MITAAIMMSALTASQFGPAIAIEAEYVITAEQPYSSWCGEQPTYPHVGDTIYARATFFGAPEGANPEGPGFFIVSSGYEYHGGGDLQGEHTFAMANQEFMARPTNGEFYLAGAFDPINNPVSTSCTATTARTS